MVKARYREMEVVPLRPVRSEIEHGHDKASRFSDGKHPEASETQKMTLFGGRLNLDDIPMTEVDIAVAM